MKIEDSLLALYIKLNNIFFDNFLKPVAFATTRNQQCKTEMWKGVYTMRLTLDTFESEKKVYMNMLHEMVHIYNAQLGRKDNGRYGRYHNKNFYEIATKLGLKMSVTTMEGYKVVDIEHSTVKKIQKVFDYDAFFPYGSVIYSNYGPVTLYCPKCGRKVTGTPDTKLICGYCCEPYIYDVKRLIDLKKDKAVSKNVKLLAARLKEEFGLEVDVLGYRPNKSHKAFLERKDNYVWKFENDNVYGYEQVIMYLVKRNQLDMVRNEDGQIEIKLYRPGDDKYII